MIEKVLQKKKLHHYVWQNYLKNWSPDKKNIYHITSKGKIILHGIKGLAREDGFYKMGFIKKSDFQIVELLINRCAPVLKPIHRYCFYTAYSIQEYILSQKDILENTDIDVPDLINSNFYENYMSVIERSGKECLDGIISGNLTFLSDNEKYGNLSRFICHQFSRTLKMRNIIFSSLEKSIGTEEAKNMLRDFNERNWWFLVSFHAENLSLDMINNPKKRVLLLENKTTKNFITSDQPVINIHPNGHLSEDIDYYYPISPKIALLIKTSDISYFDHENITVDDVLFLNGELANKSCSTIFSVEGGDIKDVINNYSERYVF